jgi:hypothetical protein
MQPIAQVLEERMEDGLRHAFSHEAQFLVGEQLSSVTFIQDYWQLDFDGSGFTVFSSISIVGPDFRFRDGDPEFRNYLCDRIAHKVSSVGIDSSFVVITFDDAFRIELSLRDADLQGPEFLTFQRVGSDVPFVF